MAESMSWVEFQNLAIEAFGEHSSSLKDLEAIKRAFEEHPAATLKELERTGERLKQGKVRSGWRILALNVAQDTSGPVVSLGTDMHKAAGRAEAWIRRTGAYFESWVELEDELFQWGALREFAGDPVLAQRMRALWEELHPAALEREAEAAARAAEWRREMDIQGRYVARDGEAGKEARRRLQALSAELEEAA